MGPGNWKDHYEMIGNHCVLCTLSLRIDDEWVSKQDVSEIDSNRDSTDKNAFKGAVSDALKRAAVKWGIGRFLYDYDAQWVTLENGKLPRTLSLPEEFLIDEEKSKKNVAAKKATTTKEDKPSVATILTASEKEIAAFNADDKKIISTVLTKVLVDNADKKEVTAWVEGDAVSGKKISAEASAWLAAKLKSL